MDRRSNDNDEPPRRASNPNVFDDDYEIDPDENDFMPSVSDGFRPANASGGWNGDRQDHDRNEPLARHTSTSKSTDSDLRRMATRNSTVKVRDATAQDSRPPHMHNRGPSSQASPLGHRASVSSTASFATTSNGENPFEASTGPSHPYGMYPQNTMARTPSIATASTDQQPRPSVSLQRPTHPYAMYSQSGLDETALDHGSPVEPSHSPVPPIQTAIPLGFPGLGTGYHRVLGPDGEEQDIIGPDGHTEQLPPYSRYPEEGPTKASLAAEASAARVIPAPNPLSDIEDPFNTPVSPVSPLSATSFSAPALPSAPLLPSVTPARLPPQRPETQTGNAAPVTSTYSTAAQVPAEPSESSSDSLLSTEQGFTEKTEPAETKTSWRKRKLWGRIPLGVVVIVLVLIIIFAIALGAAIGTVVAKKHQSNKNKEDHRRPTSDESLPQVTGTHGTLFDATPIATPTGLGLLPTGAFSLPLGIPQESNPGCLTQANQYSAWSCKLTFAPLVVTINDTVTDEGPRQLASMRTGSSMPDGVILYGLQSPDLSLQEMQLVLDLDYKAYGPAYHFATQYDKLVVLRPDELNSASIKRQDDKNFRQRFQVRPGDYPWYCYWNSTYIEGYIFVEDNSTAASYTSFPTQPPSGSPSTSYDIAGFPAVASTTPPSVGTVVVATAAPATPSPVARREAQADPNAPPRMPPYPRIVKIEERRLPNSPQPYCQQMVLLDNGKIAPATNGNDGPKKIPLQELDPDYDQYYGARPSQGSTERDIDLRSRSDPSDACHCQWMFK